MRKIVFALQTMVLGGVEKELITVLKKIHNQYDITLLLLHLENNEILQDIPSDVKIKILNIDTKYYLGSSFDVIKQRIESGKVLEGIDIALRRLLKIGMTASNTNIDDLEELNDHFDVAVCYHIHSPLMLKYVAEKIQSSKKIAWIHNDFYTTGYPIHKLKKYAVAYDEFVAVSKKVEKEFREFCPWYQGNVSTAYNYLDADEIIRLSQDVDIDESFLKEDRIKILTIGRFAEQKGIDLAIKVSGMLKQAKIDFNWFLIGYGNLENEYRRLIKEYGVEDCFTILGKKINPYPYIKNCDISVQPSRHEAYPLVIMEGKILKKPIVCTDFDGADEQIESGVNGIIVPLNDTDALYQEISKLIKFPELRDSLSKALDNWESDDDLKEIVKHFD